MISVDLGVTITIVAYLVFVTSYIVGLRKDLNALQSNFNNFESHFDALKSLREDFIRLETKIEILLKFREENFNE